MLKPREGVAVLILGAGGFAHEVFAAASLFYKDFKIEDVCFVVEAGNEMNITSDGYSVVPEEKITEFVGHRDVDCYVAIGKPSIRRKAMESIAKIFEGKIMFPPLVPPGSSIMGNTQLGQGTIIMPGSVLTVGVTLDEFAFINIGCRIGHGVWVGAYSIVNPGCVLSGDVFIGNGVYLGSSVTVLPGLSICDDVIVGVGAVVAHSIKEPGIYVGIPAQKIKDHPENKIVSLANKIMPIGGKMQ